MAALKEFFNPQSIARISAEISRVHRAFDKQAFLGAVLPRLESLEMKERVALIAEELANHLPREFPEALAILTAALGEVRNETVDSGSELADERGLRGFLSWPLAHFVQVYGPEQSARHFDACMSALEEITRRFTAEFAIRPFLAREPERTLKVLQAWATHDCHHVRRLVSEGSRPLLPWGERLKAFREDPSPTLALLELLKLDQSEYVRRSVANHLNDISKDHPKKVLATLKRWLREAKTAEDKKKISRIARHASRTMLKKGEPQALALFGYDPDPAVAVSGFTIERTAISVGESLGFRFKVRSTSKKSQKLMIDYGVHHQKARGKTSRKVFKLSTRTLAAGESFTIESRHSFKPVSVRKYHGGRHAIELLINGRSFGIREFALELKRGKAGTRDALPAKRARRVSR